MNADYSILSELLEPSILSYVSELFASHRAFEFEFAQVLEQVLERKIVFVVPSYRATTSRWCAASTGS
jgi:hypothetical protein